MVDESAVSTLQAPVSAVTATPSATAPVIKPQNGAGPSSSEPAPASAAQPSSKLAGPASAAPQTQAGPSHTPSAQAKDAQPAKAAVAAPAPATNGTAAPALASKPSHHPVAARRVIVSESDSEDDVPLSKRVLVAGSQQAAAKAPGASKSNLSKAQTSAAAPAAKRKREDDDPKPSKPKKQAVASPSAKPAANPAVKRPREAVNGEKKPRKPRPAASEPPRGKARANGSEKKWMTLEHAGVVFPPEYVTHGIKMLYEGRPVDLTPEQEEVATFFAVMKETDYVRKPKFLENFWQGFRAVLGKKHVIQDLSKCDFTPIYEWHMAEREKKKSATKEEKEAVKREKEELEANFKYALVDGKQEQVGNFRVEPPGLFRGRGEHPKMGKIKRRIYPSDITINIGPGAPLPQPGPPYEGHEWKEVRHDNTVTWLAFWKDPISAKDFKYVWLAANSSFKSESDLAKYEKARKLKDYIGDIRRHYEQDWGSKQVAVRQMATALYFIDKLALRAGHEKDEDEADTVGCCNLKVENVECIEPNHVKFDFLGKDSIRYENTVEVETKVFENIKSFMAKNSNGKAKRPDDQLFDTFDANDLNKRLRELMEGLSVKVFRTYNASITLDRLLHEQEDAAAASVEERKADYDRANKEVAILCNHQRAVNKGHAGQMEKLQEKMTALHRELADLTHETALAVKGKGKGNPNALKAKMAKKKEQIARLELNAKVKEDLKTVALGTSKINYLDPRITVAWCKRNEVPIEKVFNKSLLSKFFWSMDVEPEYRF